VASGHKDAALYQRLRVDLFGVGVGGGYLLVLIIEAPHPLHTHSRSALYIYNAIQHLLLWLQVIRMPSHPYICSWDLRVDLLGVGGGYLLVLMIEAPHSLHTHSRSSLYIYNAIHHLLQRL
jgi:hypothetical protein